MFLFWLHYSKENNFVTLRSLNTKFISLILNELEKNKKIKYKDSHRDLFFVLKRSIDDIANALYQWARDSGNLNSKMETLTYFSMNEDMQGEVFFGYTEEIIYEACLKLSNEGKAEIFDVGDRGNVNEMAVKFI